MAVKDEKLSKAIVEAAKAVNSSLIVFAPPNSALARIAAKNGLRVAYEFFADRAYSSDGSLVSRKQPNAIIHEPKKVIERAARAVCERTVLTIDGEVVNLGEVHTVCVHGDTSNAAELAKSLKKGLVKKGIDVKPVGNFIQ
jgi:UPF0271 protein